MKALKNREDTKVIWLLRHGDNELKPDVKKHGIWQPDSPLSPKGRATIERVRTAHLEGQIFAKLYNSPFRRAVETAALAVPDGKWEKLPALAPRLPKVWDALSSVEGAPPNSLEEVEERWPGLIDVETEWMMNAVNQVFEELHLGEQALLVGHQPLIGLARGTMDEKFPLYEQTLPKGGIYKLVFSCPSFLDDTLRSVECLLPPE